MPMPPPSLTTHLTYKKKGRGPGTDHNAYEEHKQICMRPNTTCMEIWQPNNRGGRGVMQGHLEPLGITNIVLPLPCC